MQTVSVALPDREYVVHIGTGSRKIIPKLVENAQASSRLVLIEDESVADLHDQQLIPSLSTIPVVIRVPSGESSKSINQLTRIYDRLAAERVGRDALILAFGGGVIGDLAGFAAASWMRGIPFLQIPTTLEAAIDASVGGKTAINLPAGKNLVGAFHQPIGVVVDLDFLATLPEREFVAGLAESIKHAVIRDPDLLAWHEAQRDAIAARDPAVVETLIARNCAIKAEVVGLDEREAGLRAILNHGHTIGHAIELELGYELRHGECVALGMRVENQLAVERGWLSASDAARIDRLLASLGLPSKLPRKVRPEAILAACRLDKKNAGDAITFMLLHGIGACERVRDISDEVVVSALARIQP